MALNLNTISSITKEQFDELSQDEQKLVLQILEEFSNTGFSQTLNDLYESDFKEQPVDIITFVLDPAYLGQAWHLPNGKCKLFPFWENKLKEIFPNNTGAAINNIILSGARGLGKSEIAVTIGLYMMYVLMCLKDPYSYLNLKATEQVAFAFINITEDLAYDIGVNKFQNTVQASPWFMARGTITGRTNRIWNPPDFIKIIVGSQPRHVIGQAIYFCLDGETEIVTADGIFKIQDLVDSKIKVFSIDDNGELLISDECTVKPTKQTNVEYQIELEDGTILKCTPEHRFKLKDGSYKEAQYLTEDDELFDFDLGDIDI